MGCHDFPPEFDAVEVGFVELQEVVEGGRFKACQMGKVSEVLVLVLEIRFGLLGLDTDTHP